MGSKEDLELKNLYKEKRTILKDVLPVPLPMCVSIEPTNLCNFKCVMCYHGNNEQAPEARPLRNMEWSTFEKTLADLKKWTGGGYENKACQAVFPGRALCKPSLYGYDPGNQAGRCC